MRTRLKLWLAALAALGLLVWRLVSGRTQWRAEADATRERLRDALNGKVAAEQAAKEAKADADLQEKRSGSTGDRLRGALDRARRRRTGAG